MTHGDAFAEMILVTVCLPGTAWRAFQCGWLVVFYFISFSLIR